jgi:hypothetical protein
MAGNLPRRSVTLTRSQRRGLVLLLLAFVIYVLLRIWWPAI